VFTHPDGEKGGQQDFLIGQYANTECDQWIGKKLEENKRKKEIIREKNNTSTFGQRVQKEFFGKKKRK